MKSYLSFLLITTFKRWSTYIAFGLYLLSECVLYFLIPSIVDKSIEGILSYEGMAQMLFMFGAISSAMFGIFLFRGPIDDGTELLMLSKPLKRSVIIWSKIIVLYVLIITLSLLASLFAIFSFLRPIDASNAPNLISGTFISSFITFNFFSAIAILISTFFKKVMIFLITIGTALAMSIYMLVAFMSTATPGSEFEKQKIETTPICLVSKNSTTDEISYEWYVVAQKNDELLTPKPITINGNPKDNPEFYNFQNYLSTKYSEAVSNTNIKISQGFSLGLQLIYMLTTKTESYFLQSPNDFFSGNDLDNDFTYEFNPLFSKDVDKYFLNNFNTALYIENYKPMLYVLNLNQRFKFKFVTEAKSYKYYSNLPDNMKSGSFKFSKKDSLNYVPLWNANGLNNAPIAFNLNSTNNIDLLTSLYTTFFNKDVLGYLVNDMGLSKTNFNQTTNLLYSTIFWQSNFFNNDVYETFADNLWKRRAFMNFTKEYSKFQYLTYQLFQNENQILPPTLTSQERALINKIIISILNPNGFDTPINKGYLFTGVPTQFKDLFIKNGSGPAQAEAKRKAKSLLATYNPFFNLLPTENLSTINNYKVSGSFDISVLIPCWTIITTLGMFSSVAIYAKKDFA